MRDVRGTCDSIIPPEHRKLSYMSCGWKMPAAAADGLMPAPAGGPSDPSAARLIPQLDVVDFASLSLLACAALLPSP